MAREFFNAYHSYLSDMDLLSYAERGRLFTACLIYSTTGEVSDILSGNERFIFAHIKSQIDRDIEKYNAKCAQNSKNALKRPQANGSDRKRPQANGSETSQGKGKGEEEYTPPYNPPTGDGNDGFVKPTVEEVAEYCRSRNNGIDAEYFIAHYDAVGWTVGKKPMQNWKAVVCTWERKRKDKPPSSDGPLIPKVQKGDVIYELYERNRRAKRDNADAR